jgi:hypothetical protein
VEEYLKTGKCVICGGAVNSPGRLMRVIKNGDEPSDFSSLITSLLAEDRALPPRRFENIPGARARYGGSDAAWRKWVRLGLLGKAVVRCGRLVMLDTAILDSRIAETGQLLVSNTRVDSAHAEESIQQ